MNLPTRHRSLALRDLSAAASSAGDQPKFTDANELRALLSLTSDWYWEQDVELRFTYVVSVSDPALTETLRSLIIGKTRDELQLHGVSARAIAENRERLCNRSSFRDFEYAINDGDGTVRWISVSGEPVFSAQGDFLGYRGVTRDISARKQAEVQIREIEVLLRQSGAAIFSNGLDAKILSWSPGAERLLGYSADEALGRNAIELLLTEGDRAEFPEIMERIRTGEERAFERCYRTKSGDELSVEVWCYPFFDANGDKRGEVVIARDITEQRRTQQVLAEVQERYRTLVEHAPDSIVVHENGIFRYVNAATVALAGASSAEDLVGRRVVDFILEDEHTNHLQRMEALAAGERVTPYAVRKVRRLDGEVRVIATSATAITEGGRQMIQVISRDITERGLAQQALEEAEARYSRLVELAPDAIIVHDNGVIEYVNPAAVRLYAANSADDMIGRHFLELLHPDYRVEVRERIEAITQGIEVAPYAIRQILCFNGDTRTVEIAASGFRQGKRRLNQVIIRDFTERVEAESQLRASEERYRLLFENAPNAIFVHEGATFVYVNTAAVALFGVESAEVLKRHSYIDFVLPEEREDVRARLRTLASGGSVPRNAVRRIVRPDGEVRVVTISGIAFEEHGRHLAQAMVQDITEQFRAEDLLRQSEERYRALFENASDGIVVVDVDRERITDANESAAKLLGLTRDALIGSHPGRLSPERQPDGSLSVVSSRDLIARSLEGEQLEFEWTHQHASGNPVYCEVRLTRIPPFERKLVRGSMVDITERVLARKALSEKEEELRYLASHDVLTGLPNRALLYERLHHAIERATRQGRELAVLFLDLDRFKTINDTLGHHAGDRALEAVATKLGGCVRGSETVARHGGDEFVIVLEDMEDRRDADHVARRVIDTLGGTLTIDGNEMFLNASIGIAVFPLHGSDPETLIRHADEAMYLVKQSGRNDYRFFHESMDRRSVEHLRLENDLRRAVAREELRLHYQPKVRIADGAIIGFEALLRWARPGAGLVAPMTFIPLAEEIGLIVEMGYWAVREAARQIRQWEAQGTIVGHVAVNLSPRQFRDAALARRIAQILDEEGVAPERIQIEVTESVTMQDEGRSLVVMQELKDLGIAIAMDDFGTGYSSLANIMKFPISTLKVDRTFIAGTPADPEKAAIAQAVVAMGLSLQLDVVAEGVETAAQLEFLRMVGCEYVQGYLLSRPVPPEQAVGMIGNAFAILPCI